MLRIGVIGKRGLSYVAGLNSCPGARVTALCEADIGQLPLLAEQHNLSGQFPELEAMLPTVDAVVVATPMPLHVPQTVLALNAGKHVLSEVTAAVTLDECWQLKATVERSQAVYMMAENYCYFRDNVLVKRLVQEGCFGTPYFGEGEYLHEVRNLFHSPDGTLTWRGDRMANTRGNVYPTHSLGPVMQWFRAADPAERIAEIICVGSGTHTAPEYACDDTTLLLCSLQSGKLIKLRLDLISNRPHQFGYYSLQGTKGVYESSRLVGGAGQVWFGNGQDGQHRDWQPLCEYEHLLPPEFQELSAEAEKAGHGGGDFWAGRDFARAISEGVPPAIDVYDALEWTAAGLCSQQSIAHGGARITLPDFRSKVV